ncbi:HAD-IIIC family phosphatase [Streptomyces sp. MST-110588]|uniref:HAD-IIIC family phosphatase n=1 Tax=Streptomyces sp. MST-110588 TaxID=2833628 RepID=UPI001F5C510F|nr:HAD-IIIC family phosphatase [Streptomyces sp. MST-110588]UNO38535.1 HAD-IIIC family phosphatase [Streptomyces sp. MST-110588]
MTGGTAGTVGIPEATAAPTVKCLVWDLDGTVWDGTVLEGDAPRPFPAALETLRTLDERGILHAVASRSDPGAAAAHLAEHGLTDLFTLLDIGWGAKSEAVRRIAGKLNIGIDTVAFIDNDPMEREEIAAALPQVRCYPADLAAHLPERPEFRPPFVTDESRQRRALYRGELRRKEAQESYEGAPAQFLASLDLELTVRRATEEDLARAHELTVRTHQLNTTGRTYDMDALRALCASPRHQVLVASLRDRFGSYGTIGLALTERTDRAQDSVGGEEAQGAQRTCVLRLLLLSCRVMSRGVGPALIGHIARDALARGLRPLAEFVPTEVNRVMLVNLRFSGFEVVERTEDRLVLGPAPGAPLPPPPAHVRVRVADADDDAVDTDTVHAVDTGNTVTKNHAEPGPGPGIPDVPGTEPDVTWRNR